MTVSHSDERGVRQVSSNQRLLDEYLGLGMEEGINSGFDQLADVVAEMRRKA
jgi:hypothetical protein